MGAAIAVLACVFLATKKPAPPAVVRAASPPPALVATVATQTEAPAAPEILAVEKLADGSPAPKKSAAKPAPQTAANAKPKPPKPEIQDPGAREALELVGVNPAAEAYWMDAIFDPSLPDQEREDLMEDLNEAGLSNPDHPTPEDLVLLAKRLPAIEAALPDADEFMIPHLLEAAKDIRDALAGN